MSKKNLLQKFNSQQLKTSYIFFSVLLIYLILNSIFQYYEKNVFLDQQINHIAQALRKDVIDGNRYSAYEQCRSLLSEESIEHIRVSKNNFSICDLQKLTRSIFYITAEKKILFNPADKNNDRNVAALVEISIKSNNVIYSVLLPMSIFLALIYVFYISYRKTQLSLKMEVISPIQYLIDIMQNNPKNISAIVNKASYTNDSEIKKLLLSYVQLTITISEAENLIREQAKLTAIFNLSQKLAHDIRSPISTLNLISSKIEDPDIKSLQLAVVEQINAIANGLLSENKSHAIESQQQQTILKRLNTASTTQNHANQVTPTPQLEKPKIQTQALTKLFLNLEKEYAFKKMAIAQTVVFEINYDDITNTLITTDVGTLIYRSINNFVQNAIEATPTDGQITIACVKSKTKNNFLEISVTDTGKGIPAHIIERLGLEKLSYGKATNTESSFNSGSGIALFNAKNDMLKFNGDLVITSTENVGTKICLLVALNS